MADGLAESAYLEQAENDSIMNAEAFTIIAYGLFCFVTVFPPTEVVSAGLTIEKLFSALLGDEQLNFTDYHIRRTTLTILIHSLLPLGLFVVLELQFQHMNILQILLFDVDNSIPSYWRYSFWFALLLPLAAMTLAFYWKLDDWREHPAVRSLHCYGNNWRVAATRINEEYRRFDKFSVALGSCKRVIVTDSWIILITPYSFQISQQSDARLTMISSDSHVLSHHSETLAQFLDIRVENIAKPIAPFMLRLNSLNYNDLRAKLAAPISAARDVIVQKTLDEQFVLAFTEAALRNTKTVMTDEEKSNLDNCLGCGLVQSNVKLEKNCIDTANAQVDGNGNQIPLCRQCFCRPMWCISCMGRWFAARQDPHRPDHWLEGKSPCPTCRAEFCLLDVSLVESAS